MARQRRNPSAPQERRPQVQRYGPRGGLAGASDDFADYLHEDEYAPRDAWDGWSQRGVYGRGAAHDRVDRGPAEAPPREERYVQDYRDLDEDADFGGHDSADYYARYGSNQARMAARRERQAQHARPGRRGLVVDPRYGLEEGPREFGRHYQPDEPGDIARRHFLEEPFPPDDPDLGPDRRVGYGAYGGEYAREGEDPHLGWPGRDFPLGRTLGQGDAGAAQGEPGMAEPSYGGSPTRQAPDHRGRGPRVRRADGRIREDLCERLTEDPWIDASDVQVECSNGTVVLEGEVETRRMKHRAEDVAAACPGVHDIDNRLRVRQRGVTRAEQPAPW